MLTYLIDVSIAREMTIAPRERYLLVLNSIAII